MKTLKNQSFFFISFVVLLFSGCQLGYLIKSANNQISMMVSREPIEVSLKNSELTEEQKRKIILSQEAKKFAIAEIKLKDTDNYTTFINLKRPYVTWVVHAAYKWQMKNYEWSYPIVGKMPYKGFFTEAEALEEAKKMQAEGYDTFVRGVTAYSTLGYFSDSVLSSMLRYSDYDLVNTIIHETVHSTIYIKNNADFNERLAVFIGNKGTEMFYHKLEGAESPTVKKIENENHDDFIFSQFITDEIKKLTAWYSEQIEKNESLREEKFMQIQLDFKNKILPKMNNKNLNHSFLKTKMNNAYLGLYKTYMQDLSDFEKLYSKCNSDIILFMQEIKKLEKSDNPEEDLKKLIL